MAIQPALVTLDALTLATAIAVFLQALKAHRVIRRRTTLAFSACFAFITAGILLRLFTDSIVDPMEVGIFTGIAGLLIWQQLGILLSVFCILAGYAILILIVEHEEKLTIWLMVLILLVFAVALARNLFFISHVLAMLLPGLLSWRFYNNWLARHSTSSLLVFAAFASLLLAHTAALFIPASSWFHLVYLGLRLIGFFLLFSMTWMVSHR